MQFTLFITSHQTLVSYYTNL